VQKKSSFEQGREIEERFQQYQQAMLHYDSSLQANAQASAVVRRLQDTDDTAASSDWDAGILHGSSPPGELMLMRSNACAMLCSPAVRAHARRTKPTRGP
jgi:hypothetical protein